MPPRIPQTLAQAVIMLKTQDRNSIDHVMQMVGGLNDDQAQTMQPILLEAAKLDDERMAVHTISRLIADRPEWLNARDPEGRTALHIAAGLGRLDVMDALLALGISANTPDYSGRIALFDALQFKGNHRIQDAVCSALMDAGKTSAINKSFALALAADEDNLGAVRALLRRGAGFDSTIEHDWGDDNTLELGNALCIACFHTEDELLAQEMVKLMLKSPKSKRVLDAGWDEEGGAPIHHAAFNNNVAIMGLLVKAGAQVNVPDQLADERPRTALMAAAEGLHTEATQFLLDAGANALATNAEGKNALHILAEADSSWEEEEEVPYLTAVMDLLVKAGIDPQDQDDKGNTPADLARNCERNLFAEILDRLSPRPEMRSRGHHR